MTDDFDIPEDDEDEDEDDLSAKQGLRALWEKPAVKLIVFAGGFAIVLGALVNFLGGEEEEIQKSQVRQAADVSQLPGEEVPPSYEKAVTEENRRQADIAEQIGASSLPTPVTSPRQKLEAPDAPEALPDDPLQEWRRAAELRDLRPIPEPEPVLDTELEPEIEITPIVEPIRPEIQQAPVREDLMALFTQQMDTIIGAHQIQSAQDVTVYKLEDFTRDGEGGEGGSIRLDGRDVEMDDDGDESLLSDEMLVKPGTIFYGQFLTALDSDVPGPALVQVLSGPFSGGRILGNFSVAEHHLVIEFQTLVYKEEIYGISAIALDPDTTLPGLVTEIDNHYFVRVILPAAAKFIEGMASAYAETETTVVAAPTGGDNPAPAQQTPELEPEEEAARGIEEAGGIVSEFFEEEADRYDRTIRVAAGTPLGILFLDELTESDQKN